MHKLIFAGSVSTQQSPTQQFGSRLSWLVKVLLAMTILMGMKTVFASAITCSSASITSPFAGDRVIDSGTQVGTVFYRGNLQVTLTNCRNSNPTAYPLTVEIPVDSTGAPLPGASGITVQSTTPTYLNSPTGRCPFVASASSGGLTYITFNQPAITTCTYTISFPISLKMTSATNIAANNLTALTSVFPWWARYSSTSGLSSTLNSSFSLISTACTLTTQNVTVTLPKIGTGALSGGAGATAGRTPFTLALSGCTNVGEIYSVNASWAFAEGAAGPTTIANSASGPASNVFVQLLDSVMAPIRNGGDSNLATVSTAGHYQIKHYAQYYAGGVVGSGLVKGVATLNLFYE